MIGVLAGGSPSSLPQEHTVNMRGHNQIVYLYGDPAGTPVVISSGDGGWIHLAPTVAALLAVQGYYIVGFNTRAYLSSFTSESTWLRPEDEPGDYRRLVEVAAGNSRRKVVLIGVSEGAGLSVLAATDPSLKPLISGVIGLGLGDLTELGWRWRDVIIYLTKSMPREPTFSAAAIVGRVAPVPLAAIHSTRDEFVPLAEGQAVISRAAEPKKLWIVTASDHRFSDGFAAFTRALIEALQWIDRQNRSTK